MQAFCGMPLMVAVTSVELTAAICEGEDAGAQTAPRAGGDCRRCEQQRNAEDDRNDRCELLDQDHLT
jgi:hypothetical protein